MVDEEKVSQAVRLALIGVMEMVGESDPDSIGEDTVILGTGAVLDSMGFVNFMIALDESLNTVTGCAINVVAVLQRDEASHEDLATVRDLTSYLVTKLP